MADVMGLYVLLSVMVLFFVAIAGVCKGVDALERYHGEERKKEARQALLLIALAPVAAIFWPLVLVVFLPVMLIVGAYKLIKAAI